jgi:hypothetical protein
MTIDQIEGNEPLHENWGGDTGDEIDESGDPPRLWDYTEEKPGCAFTRSIGVYVYICDCICIYMWIYICLFICVQN